jgi:hypothetical protein
VAEIDRWSVALAQEIPYEQSASQELETDASVVAEGTLRGSRSWQERATDVWAREIQHEVAANGAWYAWAQATGVVVQETCALSEAASDGHSYGVGWV